MIESDLVFMVDDGRSYQIGKILFEIDKWEFSNDGMYGHIYFTVPKDSYEYDSNNGAYCYNKDEHVDGIHIATPCCFVNPYENLIKKPLLEIFKEAIAFADSNLKRK